MGLTFQKADAQADLDWWSRNHGTGMLQNWPMFEVQLFYCNLHLGGGGGGLWIYGDRDVQMGA